MKNRECNLYVFPFAGATSRLFLSLKKSLPPWIHVHPVDPPGHGARCDEDPLPEMNEIVEDVISQIRGDTNTPFALYGHSFGGRIAEVITYRLSEMHHSLPIRLFLSGSVPSDTMTPLRGIEKLPDETFLSKLESIGGNFPSKEEFPEYYEQFIRVLRADFSALYNYNSRQQNPIDIPLTIFWSDSDIVKLNELRNWEKQFTGGTNYIELKGNHFFPIKNLKQIGEQITRDLLGGH